MIRIDQVLIALAAWMVVSGSGAMVLPSAAQAACEQWNVGGGWTISQTNGVSARFDLQQSGSEIQGSAAWSHLGDPGIFLGSKDTVFVNGSVDGTINGDVFEVTVYWNNDTIGVYSGKVGPQGRILGTTADKMNPHSVASWRSDQTVKCLATAGPPPAKAPPASEPLALGRVKGSSGNAGAPPKSICESARSARARNSPAAPGLERQCAAAGG